LHADTPLPEQVDWLGSHKSAWQMPPPQFDDAGQSEVPLHSTHVEVAVSQNLAVAGHCASAVHAGRQVPEAQRSVLVSQSPSLRHATQALVVVLHSLPPQSAED
jgi:hypothetical protein